MKKSLSLRRSLMRLALGIGLTFGGLNLFAQTPNLQTAVENAQTPQDQRIQQLQERLEQIQIELTELKHVNSTQPETGRAIPPRPLCRPQPYPKRRSR
jgi:TolA-binding protein